MLQLTQSKVHFIFQAKEKLVFFDVLVRKKVEIRISMKTKVEIPHVSDSKFCPFYRRFVFVLDNGMLIEWWSFIKELLSKVSSS